MTEQTVTEDTLTASLEQLVKAAGVPGLKKGAVGSSFRAGGIENSGFNDEDGKQGGGQASGSDAGGIEELMIGKLVDGGMEAGAASEMAGFMVGALTEAGLIGKKCEDDGEEEEEEEGEEKEDMAGYARGYMDAMKKMGKSADADKDEEQKEEKLTKSFADQFSEDKDIGEGIDASPFLDALTAKTTGALDALAKSIDQKDQKQSRVNEAMAKAIMQIGMLVKSQSGVVQELGTRLGMVEKQPAAAPKGARTLSGAKALAKSVTTEQTETLSKSEAAAALSYMRFVKSMTDIEGEPIGQLAIFAESGGTLSKGVHEYMMKWLATHPNEKEAALSYR